MTWNNRIVKSKTHSEHGKEIISKDYHYSIREVYYDNKSKITGWTDDFLYPVAESVKDLSDYLTQWQEAFKLPILLEKNGKLIEIK